MWRNESEALSLTGIQPELLLGLQGIFPEVCEFVVHYLFSVNQQGERKGGGHNLEIDKFEFLMRCKSSGLSLDHSCSYMMT